MATTYWTGGISTDYDTVGNWTNGIPAANDTVIVPASATRSIMPNSSQTLIQVEAFLVRDGYRGDIGAPGNPLIIAAKKMIYRGLGTLNYEGSATLDTGAYMDNASYVFEVDSDNLVNVAHIAGPRVCRLLIKKGKVTTAGGNALECLEVSYRDNPLADACVISGKAAQVLFVLAGELVSDATHLATYMEGGNYHYTGGSWTTLNLSGGKLIYDGSGNVGTARLMSGTLDFRGNPNEIQITNLWLFPDAILHRSPTLTVLNEYSMTAAA